MRTRMTLITIVLLATMAMLLVAGSIAAGAGTVPAQTALQTAREPNSTAEVRVTQSLKPMASVAASPIITWEYDQVQPAIAYGLEAGQYLVVWEDHHWGWGGDWDIYGRRVGADGTPIGGHFAISWEGNKHRLAPDVAYHPAIGEYLVVWEYEYSLDDHDIYARRVASDGALIGGELPISTSATLKAIR